MHRLISLFSFTFLLVACGQQPSQGLAESATPPPEKWQKQGRSYLIASDEAQIKMRITPYGNDMIRVQRVAADTDFYPDDHYEMVEQHTWSGELTATGEGSKVVFSTARVSVSVNLATLSATYALLESGEVLAESGPITYTPGGVSVSFAYDPVERFTGLGHGYYARAESIDLRGQAIERNYGKEQIEQAPLIVPFYLSSKGYGLFVNSTFSNRFSFGHEEKYNIALTDEGFGAQMDLFFIAGPDFPDILNNYTSLTGRPRLPAKSMFGLQLSDKGHDHNSPTPSDEAWWKEKIAMHKQAGFPLDHVVNDNRWRASGGKRCESEIAWDRERYPDPAEYGRWLAENGLTITLDFNRCIAKYSEGWKPEFNLPEPGKIDFKDSAPDLTHDGFRQWFWQVFYDKALNPELGYPGEALWIDEFDEQGGAPKDMVLANGRSSAEMRNYWFFLIAKALVAEGWDKSAINKRPFVWVRGMTAGAQRYATLWSGDIYPNYQDMEGQIRGMQLAGLSGFPFWGHDAGGFFDWKAGKGPDEKMYAQWSLAFGSFAPIWKPHGMGASRWPLDRDGNSQALALRYSKLRYELMPYTYSLAHQAAVNGAPIARPMVFDHQHQDLAWEYDLQYLWGPDLLVAPLTSDEGKKSVWLPAGSWYDYHSNRTVAGDQVISVEVANGMLPLFVRNGAIIPRREYAQSTFDIDKEHLTLDVYTGADGRFTLTEDDDVTEDYRKQNARMETRIEFSQSQNTLVIHPVRGEYQGAPQQRSYLLNLIGAGNVTQASINGVATDVIEHKDKVSIRLPALPLSSKVEVKLR